MDLIKKLVWLFKKKERRYFVSYSYGLGNWGFGSITLTVKFDFNYQKIRVYDDFIITILKTPPKGMKKKDYNIENIAILNYKELKSYEK